MDTIPSTSLPIEYGGTATLVPVDEARHNTASNANAKQDQHGAHEDGAHTRGRWVAVWRGVGRLGRAPVGPLRTIGEGVGKLLRRGVYQPTSTATHQPPKLLLRAASLQVAAALHPLLVRVVGLVRRMIQLAFGAGV